MNCDSNIRGLYINLERSETRKASCETAISRYGLTGKYKRFCGIEGREVADRYPDFNLAPGKLGCWLSHMNAIEAHLEHPSYLHILEDDFVFTSGLRILFNNIDHLADRIGEWDIIFTDVDIADMRNASSMRNLVRDVESLFSGKKIRLENAAKLYAAGNSSYVIHKDKKEKVWSIMQEGFKEGKVPKDIYLRERIRKGDLKAFVTLPFLTSVSEAFNDSTILGSIASVNPSIMLATMFRQSLAWGADTKRILRDVKKAINSLHPISDRGMIYAHLIAHFVSDDYQPY